MSKVENTAQPGKSETMSVDICFVLYDGGKNDKEFNKLLIEKGV